MDVVYKVLISGLGFLFIYFDMISIMVSFSLGNKVDEVVLNELFYFVRIIVVGESLNVKFILKFIVVGVFLIVDKFVGGGIKLFGF